MSERLEILVGSIIAATLITEAQARLIEAIARFDRAHSGDDHPRGRRGRATEGFL